MGRFVALLRGVNVGANKRVPMAQLRALLAGLEFTEVSTLLNSGNAVFTARGRSSKAHAKRIETALLEAFGFEVPVIVKSSGEFTEIAQGNGLAVAATNHSRLLVTIVSDRQALARVGVLLPQIKAPEKAHIGSDAIYLWCPNGILESKAAELLLGKLGRGCTTRNWATIHKLSTMLEKQ